MSPHYTPTKFNQHLFKKNSSYCVCRLTHTNATMSTLVVITITIVTATKVEVMITPMLDVVCEVSVLICCVCLSLNRVLCFRQTLTLFQSCALFRWNFAKLSHAANSLSFLFSSFPL